MATKVNGVEEWVRAPPPQGSVLQRMMKAIYNTEEKSFLGRTGQRWVIVLTFYLVFYIVLAVLFGVCMGGLFLSIDENRPTYTLERSLIGVNPGVASRPLLDGAVLSYVEDNRSGGYKQYIDQLEEFFEPYLTNIWYLEKEGCKFNDDFGYPHTPCIFIKLNKIFDWQPEYYKVNDLPADMPEDLKEHIQSLQAIEQDQVWISCAEEYHNETIIEYPWGRGLPAVFYPYVNTEGYKSPLVAIRIKPSLNVPAAIRCWAWARNIVHNPSLKEPSGYTRVLIHVEEHYRSITT